MNRSRHLSILVASAFLALLLLAPGGTRETYAGIAQPPNDDFTDATEITQLPFSGAVDTTGATNEPHEPVLRCGPSGNTTPPPSSSVWYRFDATSDAVLSADTLGSDFETILGLFVETDFGLENVTCTSSAGSAAVPGALTVFRAFAGSTYVFQVGGRAWPGPTSGNLVFNMIVVPPPANDDFADAELIGSLPASMTADVAPATIEPDEPISSCVFGAGGIDIGASAWYRLDSAIDGFVRADTVGDHGSSRFVTTVYRGDGLQTLEEEACGTPFRGDTRVGFQVASEETLYVQVATLLLLPPVAGHFESTRVGDLGLSLGIREIDLPTCPVPVVRFEDSEEDVSDFFAPPVVGGDYDVRWIGVTTADSYVCLELEFARPVPKPGVWTFASMARIDIDADNNASTGSRSSLCAGGDLLGVETSLELRGSSGLLLHSVSSLPLARPPNYESTVVAFDDNVMTVMIPSALVGSDHSFRLAMQFNGPGGRDCAPDRGFIQIPPPALGDVNCDGKANAIDAALVLQFEAGLLAELSCQYVADINQDGVINSIDALFMLYIVRTPL